MVDQLTIAKRQTLQLASIMARRGASAACIGARLGLALPTRPGWVQSSTLDVLGTGPGSWLALAEGAGPDWSDRLSVQLAGLASVSDQSGGTVVFRFAGPGARALLQSGVTLDLHPDNFGPGAAATTAIAHIGVVLWRTAEKAGFEVALFRSYKASFRHWIETSAAAQGLAFQAPEW